VVSVCVGLGVGGLWAKGKRAMCQLPIKKLKILEEKAAFLAPGGLTGCRRAQLAGTIHGRVEGGVGLGVGGLWAKGKRAMCQL